MIDSEKNIQSLCRHISAIDNKIIASISRIYVKCGKRVLEEKGRHCCDDNASDKIKFYPSLPNDFVHDFIVMFNTHFCLECFFNQTLATEDNALNKFFSLLDQRLFLALAMLQIKKNEKMLIFCKQQKLLAMRKWMDEKNAQIGYSFLYAILDRIMIEFHNI